MLFNPLPLHHHEVILTHNQNQYIFTNGDSMNDDDLLQKRGFQFQPIRRKVSGVRTRRQTRAKLQSSPITDKVGLQTERRFYRLMSSLILREDWLVRCEKTRSTVDIHEHTDFILTFKYRTELQSVAVQVKTSNDGAYRFRIKYPHIPVFVAGRRVTDICIIQQVENHFRSIFRI